MAIVRKISNGYYEIEFTGRAVDPKIASRVERAFEETSEVPEAQIVVNERRPNDVVRKRSGVEALAVASPM